MTEALRYLISVDQCDPCNLLVGELSVRYLVMIEAAADRNPRMPDWEGLESMVAQAVNGKGAVEVPKFANWVSTVQRDRAMIMKQGRLLREERAAESKRKAPKGGKGGDEAS